MPFQSQWSCPHIVPLTLSRKAGLFSWTLYLWYTGLFRRLAVSKASDMGTLFFITLFSSSDSWLPDTLASPCHRQGTTQTLSPAAIQVTRSRCWLTKKSYRWLIEFYKAGKSKSTQGTVSAVFKLRPEGFSWNQVAKQKLQPQLPEKVFRMQRKLHKWLQLANRQDSKKKRHLGRFCYYDFKRANTSNC